MLIKSQLFCTFYFLVFVYSRDIIVKLDPKDIIDTIVSEASVKYLTKLAQVFAKKAAETFINEIKNNEHLIEDSKRAKSVPQKAVHKYHIPSSTKKSVISDENVLNEEEAYKLLEKPSPDGDNLGWHSREKALDDDERKDKKKAIPVYGLMKVNGIYVRRLLGLGVM